MSQSNNSTRKLKITPKFFPRQWNGVTFPEIRLAGKWLQDLGFTCGKFVTISHEENKLVITVQEEVKQEAAPPEAPKGRNTAKIVKLDNSHIPINHLFRIK